MLDDPNDADDAFQATFLVLVKKAGAIQDRDLVGNWLYGVAHRVALRCRADLARRRRRESARDGFDVADPATSRKPRHVDDLRPLLHEEVARLPWKYRKPVVLCYFQGQTHESAAQTLGWPLGTVKGRLSRARSLLRARLIRRGVAPTTVILANAISRKAVAMVPETLTRKAVNTAMALATGKAITAGTVSTTAVSLMERTIKAMWFTKLKLIAAGLLAAGIVAAGAGVSGNYLGSGDGPTPDQQDKQANNRPPDDGRPDDQAGEPSDRSPVVDTPTGGDVRKQALEKIDPRSIEPIGPQPIEPSDRPPTVDALRGQDVRKQALEKIGPRSIEPIGPQLVNGLDPIAAERLKAAIEYAKAAKEFYERGTVTIDRYISASQRLMEAQQDPAQTPAQHREAAEAHAARMKTLETLEGSKLQAGISSIPNVAEARLAVAEAEYLLHRAQGSQRPDEPELPRSNADQEEHFKLGQLVLGEAVVRRQGSAPGDDGPGSRLVLTALEEPIAMRFANETPLEDIIQYIKEATQSADLPNGIPVYVDPIGLNEAEVTETSPVTIALEGVPLKRTLQLALRQIRLAYGIKDGVLIISAPGGPLEELLLEPSIFEPSEATILEVKAKRGEISDEEIQRLERLKEARPMPSGSGFQ